MSTTATLRDELEIAGEIIERSPAIAIRVTGGHGRWKTVFITKNIANYGYSHDEFMRGEVTWFDVIHPDDRDDLINLLNGFAEMRNDKYSVVYRLVRKDGTSQWVTDTTVVVRDEAGAIRYCDCLVSDYTETKDHIERIGENFRQQAVLNEILQGLHDSDLDKALQIILDRSGAYLDISRVILFEDYPDHKSARAIHEWRNKGIPSVLSNGDCVLGYSEDIPEIAEDLAKYGYRIINCDEIPPGCMEVFENECVTASAVFAVKIQNEPFGYICFDECVKPRRWSRDIVRFLDNVSRLVAPVILRRRNEQIIQTMALTDQLTGLWNRYHLETRLNEAIVRAREMGQSGYVLFIDMDDFKIINDAYGHDYGDVILKEVASFLVEHFGDSGTIFRFGGDEFVILMEPGRTDTIQDVMNGIQARAQLPWSVIDRSFYCTLSIGVVRFPEAYTDSKEIIKNADIAMYQAKKTGKNNYVFFSHTLDNDSVARAEIETAMRQSIENGFEGFQIHYQPLCDLDKRIIGAEALLRWWTPEGRRLLPTQFIPLAEYLGLIVPLGEHVLRTAVRHCRRINEQFPGFFISVNVSIRQFKRQDFLERILALLAEERIQNSNVVLEITEGMAIHDMQRMKLMGRELQRSGVRMAMDDFGTGYSSLGNMRELPVDVIKIDRSFIHDVTTNAYSKSFIRFITDLVHSMGRKVCIEGVETAGQLRYCRDSAADYVQGFHLWRPMPGDVLLDTLEIR